MTSEEEAVAEAAATGYPVLLKATGGGGGIGIYSCPDEAAVRANFEAAGRCVHTDALKYFTHCQNQHISTSPYFNPNIPNRSGACCRLSFDARQASVCLRLVL